MLHHVDYGKLEDNFSFSLTDLEHGTMDSCCYFLEALKTPLMQENLMQIHESLAAHLCAYLGTITALHTVHDAEKIEPMLIELIKHQAYASYDHFNQYPINSTVKKQEGVVAENRRNFRMVV